MRWRCRTETSWVWCQASTYEENYHNTPKNQLSSPRQATTFTLICFINKRPKEPIQHKLVSQSVWRGKMTENESWLTATWWKSNIQYCCKLNNRVLTLPLSPPPPLPLPLLLVPTLPPIKRTITQQLSSGCNRFMFKKKWKLKDKRGSTGTVYAIQRPLEASAAVRSNCERHTQVFSVL